MQTIYIDISNKGMIQPVYAKQGDIGRKFVAVFMENGGRYNIPSGSMFSAWYKGSSGEGNYTDVGEKSAFSIANNRVIVELISEMLGVPGEGFICLVLTKSDGGQIGSWNIPYICEELPGFESEGAKEYYTAFSKLIESIKSNPENIVIDDTLTVSGQAADSAAVGSHFDKVNNISGIVWLDGFISKTGTFNTSDLYRKCTNFIPCGENETVNFIGETNHSNISALTFYDANKNVLATNCNVSTDINLACESTSPIGTRFVRLSYNPAKNDEFLLRIEGKTILESAFETITKEVKSITKKSESCFVSTAGSDKNNGSADAPYLTVNKAISDGYNNILLYGGVYRQTINLPVAGTIKIAPAIATEIPVFIDPNMLEITSADVHTGNVYVATTSFGVLADTPMIFQDGVPDAATLITDAERMPQQRGKEYRCDDTMIRKCDATTLSDAVAEMQGADTYKFFYDSANGKLYFTAPETDFSTHPIVCSSNGKLFSGHTRAITLVVSGIECKYMRFDISNTVNSIITNCKCSGAYASALGQFVYDNALNPRFVNCEAAMSHGKNNGDGFNSHATNSGDPYAHQSGVVLENCWSHDNMDDGWSDHQRGEAMIYGGLDEYNGMGRITPSYGTHCVCHDVYSRYNYNGFFYTTAASDGGKYGQMTCYNCVAEENGKPSYDGYGYGFSVGGENNSMTLIGCKSIRNRVGYGCREATNAARLIDCGSNEDITPVGSTGSVEIVNSTRLV